MKVLGLRGHSARSGNQFGPRSARARTKAEILEAWNLRGLGQDLG